MKPETPKPMKKGPGKLVFLFNALRDFVVARDVIPGAGLVENETRNGREISVSRELQSLMESYRQTVAGDAPDNPANPWNGGGGNTGGGTGLPGVETDPETGEPTHDGQPLGWQILKVCVDTGGPLPTPMVIKVYSSAPYIPA
jgi:hypothetical protein